MPIRASPIFSMFIIQIAKSSCGNGIVWGEENSCRYAGMRIQIPAWKPRFRRYSSVEDVNIRTALETEEKENFDLGQAALS